MDKRLGKAALQDLLGMSKQAMSQRLMKHKKPVVAVVAEAESPAEDAGEVGEENVSQENEIMGAPPMAGSTSPSGDEMSEGGAPTTDEMIRALYERLIRGE
jgi:hypothetical protein